MRVLCLLEDLEAANILAFCLESNIDVEVVTIRDEMMAIDHLLGEKQIDALICGSSSPYAKLEKFVASSCARLPLIMIKSEHEQNEFMFPDLNVVARIGRYDITSEIPEILKSLSLKSVQKKVGDNTFVRIKTELLHCVGKLEGDVFIRLSAVKYVKLFREGHVFVADNLKRYLHDRGVEHLYIHVADVPEFTSKLIGVLTGEGLGPNDIEHIVVNAFDQVHELISHLGFSPEIQALARETVTLAVNNAKTDPKLIDIVAYLKEFRDCYIPSHSFMISQLAICIASKMDWPSSGTIQKLTFAALLHDITIQSHDLAAVQSLENLKLNGAKFSGADVDVYSNHPSSAAELAFSMKELPPDVHLIIQEHHERPDGSGFPAGLNASSISPLAAVFIVSHDIVNEMVRPNFSMSQFLMNKKDEYGRGTFKIIWKHLNESRSEFDSLSEPQLA